jgi:hypothetical protein
MRTWLSFRTGTPEVRLGVALPTSSRIVPISATGVNVLTLDNLVILCLVGFWLSLRLLTDGHLPDPCCLQSSQP